MTNTYTWNPCCCGCGGSWEYYEHHPKPGHIHHPFVPAPVVPTEKPKYAIPLVESVDSSSSPKELLVGGSASVSLTLEYIQIDGATTPAIKMKTTGPGGTSTWEDAAVTSGYHILPDLQTVQPGTKIIIEVKDVVARLRWWETITS